MKKNVGTLDRVLRAVLGLALITFALTDTAPIGMFGWLGIVPLLTAFVSFCPIYPLLGLNTCRDSKNKCC